MRPIKKIFLHCSVSSFGDANEIDKWHKAPPNNWSGIGYHYVVLNGYRKKGKFKLEDDGRIELGRPLNRQGAHVRGHNPDSIGICLVGDRLFSAKQILEGLPKLLTELLHQFNLTVDDVYGHYEFDTKKTCPNIDMELLRSSVTRLMFPGSMKYD